MSVLLTLLKVLRRNQSFPDGDHGMYNLFRNFTPYLIPEMDSFDNNVASLVKQNSRLGNALNFRER